MTTTQIIYSWLAVGALLLILEILLPSFGFILVGMAGFITAALAALNVPVEWQVISFAVLSVVLIVLIRKRLLGKIAQSPGVPHRADALVGKVGEVTESIEPGGSTGRVMVEGEDWSATCDTPVKQGSRVKVKSVDSLRLIVTPL